MSVSISENAAVLAPHVVLTSHQRKLVQAIARNEGHRVKGGWRFGEVKFSLATVDAIKGRGLAVERTQGFARRLRLTYAGRIAHDRLVEKAGR